MEIENILISDEEFDLKLKNDILPWIAENLQEGYFESFDGIRIHYHYAINPNEAGAVVISHGFCEFVTKYHEMMYYFYQMGYSVFFHEYRGHGFSGREVLEIDKVSVKDYSCYVQDLKGFIDQIVLKQSLTGELILLAHSMGGAIGTLFLEEYPQYFKKAILSSPLHEMNFGARPLWQVKLLMGISYVMPWDDKYVPGQHGFDNKYNFVGSSAQSEPRYAYIFKSRQEVEEYRTYGGTYSWCRASLKATKKIAKQASKVEIPVLLFQAGMDSMVCPGGQEAFVNNSKNTSLVRFPESKHEIYNSTDSIRKDYFKKIFDFLKGK